MIWWLLKALGRIAAIVLLGFVYFMIAFVFDYRAFKEFKEDGEWYYMSKHIWKNGVWSPWRCY